MTLQQFQQRFPNEAACRSFLFQTRWPHGFCCPRCGHDEHYYIQTRELYECYECRAQTSVTAGTFMHRTKIPLQFWFLTMYLISNTERCSARWLANTLQLNYRTALRMLHAVRHAMRKQNGLHPLSNILETDNPTLDSSRVTAETGEIPVPTLDLPSDSDETPHEILDRDIAFIKDNIRDTDSSAKQADIRDTNSSAKQADVVTRAKQFMMGKIRQFTRLTYRGVHRKNLQSYVDEYYFRWVGRFDKGRLFFVLLCACASARPYQRT